MNVKKILFICYHREGLPNSVKGQGVFPTVGEMANVAVGRIFFSLVTNNTVKLKINICILELLILFFEDILFLYYMQVIGFCFFFEKNLSFSHISLFYFPLDMSLICRCILYGTQFIFFQKQRRVLSETNLFF